LKSAFNGYLSVMTPTSDPIAPEPLDPPQTHPGDPAEPLDPTTPEPEPVPPFPDPDPKPPLDPAGAAVPI
jgi:hypothetical protein